MSKKTKYKKTKPRMESLGTKASIRETPRMLDPLDTQKQGRPREPLAEVGGASAIFAEPREYQRIDAVVRGAGGACGPRRPMAAGSRENTGNSMAPGFKERRASARVMILPDFIEASRWKTGVDDDVQRKSVERIDSALELLRVLSGKIPHPGMNDEKPGKSGEENAAPAPGSETWKDDMKRLVADCAAELIQVREDLKGNIPGPKQAGEDGRGEPGDVDLLRGLLSGVADSTQSVLIAVDPDGRVILWNREAERAAGVSADIARGRELATVFPRLAGEMDMIMRTIEDHEPRMREKAPWDCRGGMRFSDVAVHPLDESGVQGAVIRIDDVTRRVRIEEMMIQSEKMMSVGGLAAGMAHEINNPLAGIFQNVQVMKNRVTVGLPRNARTARQMGASMETIEKYLEKRGVLKMIESVMEACMRAKKIVDNMLSFSRKSESRAAPHDVRKLLEKTLELAENDYNLKKKYDFRGITIIRDYGEDVPPALCEGSKIQQVFLNILKNGAQAMAEEASMTSANGSRKEPRFILHVRADGDMVRVEMEDNGPGMEEAVRDRIFEPFFTTKADGVGTGLGLSVSHFIITKDHNGEMTVDSTPGGGTRFIIGLPSYKR